MSKISKIILGLLIFFIIIPLGFTIYTLFSAPDGIEWVLAIIYIYSLFTIPYYIMMFIISRLCDNKVKNKIKLKNILMSIFIIIPFIMFIIIYIFKNFI